MSNLIRVELLACTVALALAGCMKIYPDPELPDVDVEWFGEDCVADTVIALSLIGVDSPTLRIDKVVPCRDEKFTFVDVVRERFRVSGELRDPMGEVLGTAEQDVDLRNGFDGDAYLYFDSFDNLYARWVFNDDATCESLAADTVELVFSDPSGSVAFVNDAPCDYAFYMTTVQNGLYSIHAEAVAGDTVVAISPESPPYSFRKGSIIDVLLALTPCGASCP